MKISVHKNKLGITLINKNCFLILNISKQFLYFDHTKLEPSGFRIEIVLLFISILIEDYN